MSIFAPSTSQEMRWESITQWYTFRPRHVCHRPRVQEIQNCLRQAASYGHPYSPVVTTLVNRLVKRYQL